MVFVDTSAWFGFLVPADPAHAPLRQWFAVRREPLVTTDYCVDETLTLLRARGERRRALEAGRAFFQEDFAELVFLTPDQLRRAWIYFQTAIAADWSFTDCTSKIAIDDLSVRTVLTLDDHFRRLGTVQVAP